MWLEPVYLVPEGEAPENAEYMVFAVVFEEEDWAELGVNGDSLECNSVYFGKNEFSVFRMKLSDPLYLHRFYAENSALLKERYWRSVTRNRFVRDTVQSVPEIFSDFTRSCQNKGIYDFFEPLDNKESVIREENEEEVEPHQLVCLKSKFGFIQGRIPFRLYAVEVDVDCFIITGGAIKIVEEMTQAPNTRLELKKLEYVLNELIDAGISNKKNLLDFII